jgi:hypothetical protein
VLACIGRGWSVAGPVRVVDRDVALDAAISVLRAGDRYEVAGGGVLRPRQESEVVLAVLREVSPPMNTSTGTRRRRRGAR